MIVIPAIDIKGGKCVRLLQGQAEKETVFSDDPAAMALRWASQGAQWLHVIDLDGAFEKGPRHPGIIKKILASVEIPIQLGGGIRDEKTVEMYLEMGIRRVIIGTRALEDPAFVRRIARRFPGRIAVGIDARNGWVAVDGWTRTTRVKAVELARQFEDCGVAAINFTDIHRDGMQTGPNLEETRLLAEQVDIPVIASGGVATLDDIRRLLPLETAGVVGVITGKALYSGSLNFRDALALVRTTSGDNG